MAKRTLKWGGIAAIVVFLGIQLARPERSNPNIDPSSTLENSGHLTPAVTSTLRNSCYDCHSNETRWPWYTNIAPASWLVAGDVRQGRQAMNFSEWGTYSRGKMVVKLGQIYEEVSKGEMPLGGYLLLHPNAVLTANQVNAVLAWTEAERDSVLGNSQ